MSGVLCYLKSLIGAFMDGHSVVASSNRRLPVIEHLEDRVVPAAYVWTGGGGVANTGWTVLANWAREDNQQFNQAPGEGDTAKLAVDKSVKIDTAVKVQKLEITPAFNSVLEITATGSLKLLAEQEQFSRFNGGANSQIRIAGAGFSVESGHFVWEAGNFSTTANGSITVKQNATFYFANSGESTLGVGLNIEKDANVDFIPLVTTVNAGSVSIVNNGTFTIKRNAAFVGGQNAIFTNDITGTLIKDSLSDATLGMKFISKGHLIVKTGIFNLTGATTEQTFGKTSLANGTTLAVSTAFTITEGILENYLTPGAPANANSATVQVTAPMGQPGLLKIGANAVVSPGGNEVLGVLNVNAHMRVDGLLRMDVRHGALNTDRILNNSNTAYEFRSPFAPRIGLFESDNEQPPDQQIYTLIKFSNFVSDGPQGQVRPALDFMKGKFLQEISPAEPGSYRIRYKADPVKPGMTIAPDAGEAAWVKVVDTATSEVLFSFEAYASFTGGVRVATADFNDDGIADIVTAPGAGTYGVVKVFDGTDGTLLFSVTPYANSYDGLFVAAGDTNNDGTPELIVSRDAGSSPEVLVIDGVTHSVIQTINPFDPSYFGGVRVAIGDLNGDGYNDIAASTAEGGLLVGEEEWALMEVYSGLDGSVLMALGSPLIGGGGFFVALGDLNGDGRAELILGTGSGSGSYVSIYSLSASGSPVNYGSFWAFDMSFTGGVRVAVGDYDNDGDADILVGQGAGDNSEFALYDGLSLALVSPFWTFDESFTGGVFVA